CSTTPPATPTKARSAISRADMETALRLSLPSASGQTRMSAGSKPADLDERGRFARWNVDLGDGKPEAVRRPLDNAPAKPVRALRLLEADDDLVPREPAQPTRKP